MTFIAIYRRDQAKEYYESSEGRGRETEGTGFRTPLFNDGVENQHASFGGFMKQLALEEEGKSLHSVHQETGSWGVCLSVS